MKLLYKWLIGGVIGLASVGVIAAIAVDYKKTPLIYSNGSSSVQPLLQSIAKDYESKDIISDAGGSLTGITNAMRQKTNIGMASRSPNVDFDSKKIEGQLSNFETWEKNEVKTITIAWDGIALIYKLDNTNENVVLNKNNINYLLEAFAGENRISFKQLNPNLPDVEITPYSRTGGANASGTAEAFLKYNPLIKYKDFKKKHHNTYERLHSGNYGKFTKSTEESNTQAWTNIKSDAINGSITYLSTGFIANNYEEITNSGYKIVLLENQNKDVKPFEVDENNNIIKSNTATTYLWFRPFNLITSLNMQNNENTKTFIWDILFDSNIESKIKENGFLPLTFEQKMTMFLNPEFKNKDEMNLNLIKAKQSFFVSDFILNKNNTNKEQIIFGAKTK